MNCTDGLFNILHYQQHKQPYKFRIGPQHDGGARDNRSAEHFGIFDIQPSIPLSSLDKVAANVLNISLLHSNLLADVLDAGLA